MASTLKMCEASNIVARTAEEAFRIIMENKYNTVVLVSSKQGSLSNMVSDLMERIKQENLTIEIDGDQWLPTNAYYWGDIDGCLSVRCAEVSMGKFAERAGNISFSGWNYEVLRDPSARKPISSKAMATLALLGGLISS